MKTTKENLIKAIELLDQAENIVLDAIEAVSKKTAADLQDMDTKTGIAFSDIEGTIVELLGTIAVTEARGK